MVGGFEYQLLDKGDRTPQQLYDEAVKFTNAVYKEDKEKDAIFTLLNFTYTATLPQMMIEVDASKAMAQNVSIQEAYNALASYFGRSYISGPVVGTLKEEVGLHTFVGRCLVARSNVVSVGVDQEHAHIKAEDTHVRSTVRWLGAIALHVLAVQRP